MKHVLNVFSGLMIICFFALNVCAKEQFPFIAQVKSSEVNIRAGQNVNFEKLGVLKEKEEVVIVGHEFSWYKIQLPISTKVYIRSDYVLPLKDSILEITGTTVNIRSGKNSESTAVGKVKKGDLLKKIAQEGDWVQVEPLENFYGWVHEDYLEFESKSVPQSNLQAQYRKVLEPSPASVIESAQQAPQPSGWSENKIPDRQLFVVSGRLKKIKKISGINYQLRDGQRQKYLIRGSEDILKKFNKSVVSIEGYLNKESIDGLEYEIIDLSKVQFVL